jgi:S-phase kinase-associated protein 1
MSEEKQCQLVPKEGGVGITVPLKAAQLSKFVLAATEESVDDKVMVVVPEVGFQTLAKVTEFMTHHQQEPLGEIVKPLRSNLLEESGVPRWYCQFVEDVPLTEIYLLIKAANFMDIKPLLELGAAKVATMIKGKSSQEIRDTFNLP